MKKENQSLLDFLQTTPFSSFVLQRHSLSNKEAQALYDIWSKGEKDEYGKHILPNEIDAMQVASLTSKGYIKNQPSRYATSNNVQIRTLEFTNKGKETIKKIILHEEKSSFEKSSGIIDFEAVCRASAIAESKGKTASVKKKPQDMNWLERII